MIALDDLNELRTSVPAALGVRHLAPKDGTTLAVLGKQVRAGIQEPVSTRPSTQWRSAAALIH